MRGTEPVRPTSSFVIILLALATIMGPTMAVGAEPGLEDNEIGSPSGAASDHLRAQDPKGAGLFYNGCKAASAPSSASETYVLAISGAGQFAFLVLLVDQDGKPVVANMATLSLGGGRLSFVEAMGGEWTYARLRAVAEQLQRRPFKLTFDYSVPLVEPPSSQCALEQ
jgi:hypothetical protein